MPSLPWLVIGLALFVLGLHTLSDGLRQGAGPRLRRVLASMTKSRWRGLLTGAAVTGVIQSSSATNVMVVGFAQAGLLDLTQAVSVMLGANVGTTVTSQLLACDIHRWAPLAVGLGVAMHGLSRVVSRSRARRWRFGGQAAVGFGALLLGMEAMRLALAPVGEASGAADWMFQLSQNPYWAVAAGAAFTGLVQSSSMTTGMTMVMVHEGVLAMPGALGIVLGANVGTVVTTLVASIGTDATARRAAVADLVFNVVGVALFIPFLPAWAAFIARTAQDGPRQVANAHLLFNVLTALAVLPVVPQLVAVVESIVPGRSGQD